MKMLFLGILVFGTISAFAGSTRSEQSAEIMSDSEIRTIILDRAIAVDNISVELQRLGVVLTEESIKTLQDYSNKLKAEAAHPKMGHRFKKMMKKTGHGLKKVGGFVLKTMGYAGKVGAGVVFLPISVIEGFVEGLVTGSNPSEPLEVTGIITGVVTAGVVLAPLAFSGPGLAVMLTSLGFGALSMPATLLMCNDDFGISDDNEKFCDNLDRVSEIVFSGPGDVTFAGGAWIHDSAGKLIQKIFHRKH